MNSLLSFEPSVCFNFSVVSNKPVSIQIGTRFLGSVFFFGFSIFTSRFLFLCLDTHAEYLEMADTDSYYDYGIPLLEHFETQGVPAEKPPTRVAGRCLPKRGTFTTPLL